MVAINRGTTTLGFMTLAPPKVIFAALAGTALASVVYLLVRTEYALTDMGIAPALPDGSLNDAQTTSINLLVTLSTILINWTFATIAGAAYFLKLHLQAATRLGYVDISLVMAIFLFCISSLYFAQLSFDIMIRSLSLQQYPFEHDALFVAFKWQFILGLAGVLCLGLQSLNHCLTLKE